MDRSDNSPSDSTSLSKPGSSSPFPYQQRLLERTSSRGGAISRSNSLTNKTILANLTGSSTSVTSARRCTSTHRVGSSLDGIRKWEDRVKPEGLDALTDGTKDEHRFQTSYASRYLSSIGSESLDDLRVPTPPPRSSNDTPRTPTYLKRRTLPAPMLSSPLSPNNTGVSVEASNIPSSSLGSPTRRTHLPSSFGLLASPGPNKQPTDSNFPLGVTRASPPSRYRRSNTVDSAPSNWPRSMPADSGSRSSRTSSACLSNILESNTTALARQPISISDSPYSTPSSPMNTAGKTPWNGPAFRSLNNTEPGTNQTPSVVTSAMSPTPYRSSYMANKRSSLYGNDLTTGRRLGRHLPRIASGDVDDSWPEADPQTEEHGRGKNERRERDEPPFSPEKYTQNIPATVDDVAGVPGRLRLSRDMTPNTPTSPLPSTRLLQGLWADTQRQYIQAYEYLCHVGEAQQWIEGCLGEELGFGVVEMEEGMRNGVVLAKLVRVFHGEHAVKRIYEAPKLDFRHSDNINHFFKFVRDIGLPECFIFELTDLYEKKNLPKVIYCIHALSHLLARRGMAERIGNLLGHLKFSDDQLQKTQKGLKDAGVVMPNFGDVGRELAKEINEEPEAEVETDEERRDRLLLENEGSVIAAQALLRGFLLRKSRATMGARMRLTERYIPKLQAQCRGSLARRWLASEHRAQLRLLSWAISLQAIARVILVRRQWRLKLRRIRLAVPKIVKVQAQIRGILQRRRFARLKAALRASYFTVTKLQSAARALIARNAQRRLAKSFIKPITNHSIISVQARARGTLARRMHTSRALLFQQAWPSIVALQAQCRGVLMRRRMRLQIAKLEDVSDIVIRIQSATRTYLARKHLLALIRGLRRATPMLTVLQAHARASLTRQKHISMHKALHQMKTTAAVSKLQTLARGFLTRRRNQELRRELRFHQPDMARFLAIARSYFVRSRYRAWRDHLRRSHSVATILQALLRGATQRRNFRGKMQYYQANLSKVVKIQSLFRAKETREQYRQLTMGKNVSIGTIKNFVHLLDDSEADFQEEIKVERLRKKVVERIRENQALENDVNDLDVKIALLVQNVKSFEEVIKARRRHGADSAAAHAARASLLAAHGDPFSGPATLDHAAKRKLELYQQLFYLLQTKGQYLCRLFLQFSSDTTLEKNRKFIERVVLTLFGYGQDRREDYLLLKLFQYAIRDEVVTSSSPEEIIQGHPLYINIAVHYVRPKQVTYARETLQAVIRELIETDDLDMEADPSVIHRARIDVEEMRSGNATAKPKDVPFYQALNDPDTRAEYIRHLQVLQWWTEAFVTAITHSTKRMPYGMRYLARETLTALRERFPDAQEQMYAACIGRLIYYRYINPAIITPETFDIVGKTVDVAARKNLAQVSKILTQITSGHEFTDENPSYIPINDYVRKAIGQMSSWMLEVATIPDAETALHAHEFLDVTFQPKPIYISPNEIYAIHGFLAQYLDYITPDTDDILRVILNELNGVPNLGSDELKDARDHVITLELTNRFAHVRDPQADEKALWVQAKRGVLAILRVQPAQELVESLMRPVTEADEVRWEEILENEMENERIRHIDRRMPSMTGAEANYRLEDIRSLKFAAVKALTISFLLDLESQGKIIRNDGFQGILNAIAMDVRSKHRKRLQRQQEMENMHEALKHLAERKKYFEEQINSYHSYVEAAMNTMQRTKGKKHRIVMPFTKQYFHLRDLQKSGKSPQFGSFLYTAKYLYDKGILLSIDQYSPRQFDKVQLTISSNTVGVFTLVLESSIHGATSRLASEDVKMEELLQAQFENKSSFSLFSGIVKVNLNLFLYQINKKFYV